MASGLIQGTGALKPLGKKALTVFGNGTKTYGELLNELYTKANTYITGQDSNYRFTLSNFVISAINYYMGPKYNYFYDNTGGTFSFFASRFNGNETVTIMAEVNGTNPILSDGNGTTVTNRLSSVPADGQSINININEFKIV